MLEKAKKNHTLTKALENLSMSIFNSKNIDTDDLSIESILNTPKSGKTTHILTTIAFENISTSCKTKS